MMSLAHEQMFNYIRQSDHTNIQRILNEFDFSTRHLQTFFDEAINQKCSIDILKLFLTTKTFVNVIHKDFDYFKQYVDLGIDFRRAEGRLPIDKCTEFACLEDHYVYLFKLIHNIKGPQDCPKGPIYLSGHTEHYRNQVTQMLSYISNKDLCRIEELFHSHEFYNIDRQDFFDNCIKRKLPVDTLKLFLTDKTYLWEINYDFDYFKQYVDLDIIICINMVHSFDMYALGKCLINAKLKKHYDYLIEKIFKNPINRNQMNQLNFNYSKTFFTMLGRLYFDFAIDESNIRTCEKVIIRFKSFYPVLLRLWKSYYITKYSKVWLRAYRRRMMNKYVNRIAPLIDALRYEPGKGYIYCETGERFGLMSDNKVKTSFEWLRSINRFD